MKEQAQFKEITDEIIKDTYSRLKSFVYYDNFNLALRIRLARFESDGNVTQKLSQLRQELNEYLKGSNLNSRITKMITQIGYFTVPKSFENDSNSHKVNGILISNTGANNHDKYILRKSTILIDCEIELHIIATLWIVLEGVHLVNKIGKDSYGYHIQLKEGTTEIDGKKRLFSKYFDKYQEWRDKGIRAAKKQIEDGNDVLLVSLDIKNFFHSVHVDFRQLKKDLNCSEKSLTSIIEKICFKHTQIVNEITGDKHPLKKPLLPIGLVSSGIIANWLLSDFDKSIKDKMAPVYYGRYVDDIFIVLSNVKPDFNNPKQDNSNTKDITEWIRDRFFYDNKPLNLKKTESDNGNDAPYVFELNENMCNGLTIQTKKLKLFYFSPDWPLAMLNKFEKTLEENSSAFWFLPDEEKMEDSLDDKAYDMHYEDTINKFRSVSDVKASKYGASVFLAKRIKLSTLHLNSTDEKLAKEVFRFFNGVATLSLYNMWEKVFTYLVVTKDLRSIKKLHKDIVKAINKISYTGNGIEQIKTNLNDYLDYCLSLAFSHYPELYDKLSKHDKLLGERRLVIKENIKSLRKSLLTRHHYLPFPPFVLTRYYTEQETNLIGDVDLLEILFKDNENTLELDESLKTENWRIPRWIHLQEICLLKIATAIKNHTNKIDLLLFHHFVRTENNEKIEEIYTKECISLFNELNNTSLYDLATTIEHKRYSETFESKKTSRIATDIVSIKDDTKNEDLKLTIGVSNVKVHLSHITEAINKKSILSRKKRETHIKLLNEATSERLDLLLLPETFVPFEWLFAYADEARRKQRAFIFGLEHFTVNNKCYNLATTILPIKSGKIKECFIVPRLKNHYSPNEIDAIESIGKEVPKTTPNAYHLFKWRGFQFTLYNCYELTNVVHRSIFGSELDMLFAVEYNKDVNYFSNIAESTCRDLHCYYIQANTSDYGDSRIVQPTESVIMNPIRIKGGENNVILKYKLDVKSLRQFQNKRMPYQRNDKSFKSTPPDYDHKKVNGRGT
ncbi:RNA-directed DNA polymerase [Sphingobacterium arenae]|uniref:RNA-directed DNA polymerase n=1 Tax=Sphingobacterium arenae TaxID=1280598 RepID=A0ABR7Y438_9SPHI|nr:RNA-directed DNA polymerase [Sphingobacterium arenae]MBD1426080.1 RNA-directed DNA polymerase [Sphingobacterium arenae]